MASVLMMAGPGVSSAGAAGSPGSWQVEQTYGVTPPPFGAVSCPTVTDCTAVGGDDIVATTDGGATWNLQNAPAGVQSLSGISCPTSTTCTAVGEASNLAVVVATVNGGSSWATQSVPSGVGPLSAISCPSTTVCLAVGSSFVVATTNGGTTWTLESVPGGVALSGISCASATLCAAVGSAVESGSCPPFPTCPAQPLTMMTADGGAGWATNSYPQGEYSGGAFLGVSCPSTSECTAVGDAGVLGSGEGIAITLLFGGTCTMAPGCDTVDDVSTTTQLQGVFCPSTSACTAVGGGQIATASGTSNWVAQSAPVEELDGVSCALPSQCTAVGGFTADGSGAVVDTTDGGTSWTTVYAEPFGVYSLSAVSCPSASVCTAVGETEDAGQIAPGQDAGPGVVVHTSDGGASWTTQSLPAGVGALGAVSCASTSDCEAFGGNRARDAPVIVGTTDGGATWQSQTLPSGVAAVTQLSCPSPTDCVGLGQTSDAAPAILTTTDGGSTWLTRSAPTGVYPLLAISCPSPTMCTAVGETTTGTAAIFATTDGGVIWQAETAPSGLFNLTSISCPSTSTCTATGAEGTNAGGPIEFVSTTDGGSTWSAQPAPPGLSSVSDLACASATSCTAVGQATLNGPGAAVGTSNGGVTWTSESSPPSAFDFLGVSCPGAGACTAVGDTLTSGAVVIGQAPITTMLVPSNRATVSGGAQVLDASASSPLGLASVTFEVSGGALNDEVVATASPTIYGWLGNWNTTGVPNGTYTVQSVATETDGESATSGPITVSVANQPPTTAILIPSNDATVSGGAALVDASASSNVTSITFELSGGSVSDQVVATASPTIYGWLGSWNTTGVPNGTYTLQSVASYTNGESGKSAPITIRVDNAHHHHSGQRDGTTATRVSAADGVSGLPA